MKISPQLLTDPALGTALAAVPPEAAADRPGTAPAALRQQVELLNDANIRLLLDAMGKTLGEMGKLTAELPPAVAGEAAELGQATLGAETVLPRGMAAVVHGARSGGEAFAAFARTLAGAAQLSETFPTGLQPATTAALATFATKTGEGGDFAVALRTMAGQPATTAAGRALPPAIFPAGVMPETVPAAAGQALPAAGFPAGVVLKTAAAMPDQALTAAGVLAGAAPEATAAPAILARKIEEGGDFAARILIMARQLIAAPDSDPAPAATARALLATLADDELPPAVWDELARAAAPFVKDVPEKVRRAAALHDLPELEGALARQKLADSLPWLKLPADTLRQASHSLQEMAAAVPQSDQAAAETPSGQNLLVMTMPIYFADGRSYPAYLHISRDREQQAGGDAAAPRETWLRLCVATDNLGVVDMVFYLRGEQQLSIRVAFGNQEAGDDFRRALPALRGALAASPLTLNDIAVVAVPDRP